MKNLLVALIAGITMLLVSCGVTYVSKPPGPMVQIDQKIDTNIYPIWSDQYGGGAHISHLGDDPNDNIKFYVWNGMKLYTITNNTEHPSGGNRYLMVIVNNDTEWFGWGIHVFPKLSVSMKDFKNGHLRFWVRTRDSGKFKVGVKHGYSLESWMNVDEGKYGFIADGKWCRVSIPLADFQPKIKFGSINIYWMMAQGMGLTAKPNSIYEITEIVWTKD